MTMATRIVVMSEGRIQQVGSPKEIYDFPRNMFVAGFIGTPPMNFLRGKVTEAGYFETASIKIKVEKDQVELLKKKGYIDKEVVLGIRPEFISEDEAEVKKRPDTSLNVTIDVSELLGSETNLHFTLDDAAIVAKIAARADLKIGDKIDVAFKMEKAHFFDPRTTLRINEYSPDYQPEEYNDAETQEVVEEKPKKTFFKKKEKKEEAPQQEE